MADTWHAPADLLRRFADRPDALDSTSASSVEQHLVECATCRSVVAGATSRDALEEIWSGVVDRVDRTPQTWWARAGAALGGRPTLRFVVATGPLRAQAAAAVVTLAAAAVWSARELETSTPFLATAPVLVLAVVAVAFRRGAEPAGEIAVPTPIFGFRLFLLRASTVIVLATAPLLAASTLLPGTGWTPFAWVLPSLAMSLGALAVGTRFGPIDSAVALGALWLTGLLGRSTFDPPGSVVDLVASASVQRAAAAVVIIAIGVIVWRRDTFDQPALSGGGSWS